MTARGDAGEVRRHGGRMVLFGAVGLVNSLTDFLIYAALVAAGTPPALANVAGFAAANVQSYLVNARVTFREAGRAAPVSIAGYGKFVGAHLVSLVVSTLMILMLADRVGPYASKAGAMVFTLVWNYATSTLLVFGPRAPKPGAGGSL